MPLWSFVLTTQYPHFEFETLKGRAIPNDDLDLTARLTRRLHIHGLNNLLQRRQGRGTTQRVPGVRAGHGPNVRQIEQLGPAEHSRQRQARADAVAAADQIGLNAVVFMGKELACAADAVLNLIEDHESLMAPAQRRIAWT